MLNKKVGISSNPVCYMGHKPTNKNLKEGLKQTKDRHQSGPPKAKNEIKRDHKTWKDRGGKKKQN